jgi:predicted RNA-binding protein with PUA-like domain
MPGMNYWLCKSEPYVFSWDDHVKKEIEGWNGVRNYAARNNLRAMKLGDLSFFYHSNQGVEVVGIMEVVKEAYPDPTDETGRFDQVDFKALKPLKRPVTLKEIKATPELADMALIRQSRLSVSPVTKAEWDKIIAMSKE